MSFRRNLRPVRVGVISLGCAKNLVDAEIMLGSLLQGGLQITNDPGQADALIVNTCSFIDAAQEESVDAILQSARLREARQPHQALVVSGCLPQRFRDELPKLLPEVDAFMGIDQVEQAAAIVQAALARRRQRLAQESPAAGGLETKSKIMKQLAGPRTRPGPANNARRGRHFSGQETRPTATSAPLTPRALAHTPDGQASGPSPGIFNVSARPTYIPDFATPRFRLTPRHFAYVKIAEGCNHPCAFCIIPRMRGSHRSRPQEDVVREARQLLDKGVKELNLISQDTTYYGLDLRPNPGRNIASADRFRAAAGALAADAATLGTLLRELNGLAGDFWVRILYTHPAHWTDELIEAIADCPKVARYVDIPLQHIHSSMLERMRRETSPSHIVNLLASIRARLPGIALRTTFIVGFPGETEEAFGTLLDFIRETKFERLGVFTYSQQEGTRAARMEGQIPERVKRRRRQLAMTAQRAVAGRISKSFVGRTIKVLIEAPARRDDLKRANLFSWEHGLLRHGSAREPKLATQGLMIARGEADAPDIDGRVYVRGHSAVGEFARVKIIGHTDYDLIAEPV